MGSAIRKKLEKRTNERKDNVSAVFMVFIVCIVCIGNSEKSIKNIDIVILA
jgi:hypothetical protein